MKKRLQFDLSDPSLYPWDTEHKQGWPQPGDIPECLYREEDQVVARRPLGGNYQILSSWQGAGAGWNLKR